MILLVEMVECSRKHTLKLKRSPFQNHIFELSCFIILAAGDSDISVVMLRVGLTDNIVPWFGKSKI